MMSRSLQQPAFHHQIMQDPPTGL
ncbi:unnamed protein product [Leptidea sinapis]|uniref:Uncharacterized protein n=1 Tax=Leptidea sinapis TaxID=189913 RepID=A0A5E4QRZ1_9NEOP|nr:unnamed protein product [Leptidea sinapis]